MKTSELTGSALDWAVASYADKHVSIADIHWGNYSPSTDWSQGGPIIEREDIALNPADPAGWSAYKMWGTRGEYVAPTPLIAAMRCFVASRLGDEVDIPEELL